MQNAGWTQREICLLINKSQQSVSKRLRGAPYTLIEAPGSDKKVKLYAPEGLPVEWIKILMKGRHESDFREDGLVYKDGGSKSGGASCGVLEEESARRIGVSSADCRRRERGDAQGAKRARDTENSETARDGEPLGADSFRGGADGTSGLETEDDDGSCAKEIRGGDGVDADTTNHTGARRSIRHNRRNNKASELLSAPKKTLNKEETRLEIIRYVESAPNKKLAITKLNERYTDLNLTESKYFRWLKLFRVGGMNALMEKRGGNNQKADAEKVKEALLAVPAAHISSAYNLYALKEQQEDGQKLDPFGAKAKISQRQFLRIAKALIKDDAHLRAYRNGGIDEVENLHPSYRRRKKSGEWQIDATPWDFFVEKDGKSVRMSAVTVIDIESGRRVIGLYDSANSYANVRIMHKAIKRLGFPQLLRGDNGKDFVSEHFQNVLANLGIVYARAAPYKGKHKGHVERSHKSVMHSWLENLPGFAGHNVAQRQKLEAQAARKSERSSKKATHVKNLMRWEDMQSAIDTFVETQYNKEFESPVSDKLSTNIYMRLGKSERHKASKEGIKGFGYTYTGGASFWDEVSVGKTYEVFENIDDASRCFVFDKNGVYLHEGIDQDALALSAEEKKAAVRAVMSTDIAKTVKAAKKLEKQKEDMYLSALGGMVAAVAKEPLAKMKEAATKKEPTLKAQSAAIQEEYVIDFSDVGDFLAS